MNQSQHVLAWGRKFFYGIGWFCISLIALNYHQSLILPHTFLGWIYYLTTFTGHYGLLISVVYFFLFLPVIKAFPSFILARAWSLLIILTSCFFLFIDSMIFAQYRFHLNGFIFDLLMGGAAQDIFEFPLISYAIVGTGMLIFFYFVWSYANRLWTIINLNFTPNKKWYFLMILICLMISNGLHIYGSAMGERSITALANLFPLHFPLTANSLLKKVGFIPEKNEMLYIDQRSNDFYYPHGKMNCNGKDNKNILFIIIDSWRADEMTLDITPGIATYSRQGIILNDHYSGSNNTRGGIFSVFYAMPTTYWDIALKNQTPPVFMEELRTRFYNMGIFASASLISPEFDRTVFSKVPNLRILTQGNNSAEKDINITKEWKTWISDHQSQGKKPFFGMLFYDAPHSYSFPKDFKKDYNPIADSINYLSLNNFTDSLPYLNRHKKSVSFVDTLVKDVIDDLKSKNLLENTIILITSDHGQELNDNKKNYWGHNSNYSLVQVKVPAVLLWPGKKAEIKTDLTSHYDLVPTIMNDLWSCSNPSSNYSYGDNIFKKIKQQDLIVSSYLDYGVIDFSKQLIMTVDPLGKYLVTDLQLNEVPKAKANEGLILKAFKDLSKFKIKR
jgi:membrane-anchored protein YejM (alkaline phosphatase superfamily)